MIRTALLLIFLCIPFLSRAQDFRASQQKTARVKAAYRETWPELKTALAAKGIGDKFEMYIRVFKKEEKTEVWLKPGGGNEYKLFHTYDVCSSSGTLGPKRKQGDGQVPEGFYHISVFNPYSSYHLSLGISYPNKSDRIIGTGNLGGDIMIHGSCVTIGCIPLTDKYIREVYLLAVEARHHGQANIPVHIFPSRLDEDGMTALRSGYGSDKPLLSFWESLQPAFTQFNATKRLPVITVNAAGKYIVSGK